MKASNLKWRLKVYKSEVKVGTHFWAELNDKLVIMCKCEDGYYVCGGWENSIEEIEFEIIEIVRFPNGYTEMDLCYK